MTAYGITFVDDDALTDHDFAFVAVPDGGWIFYRENGLGPRPLEDSWAAYRALLDSVKAGGGDDGPDGGGSSGAPEDHTECASEPEPAEIDRRRRWEQVAQSDYLRAAV